MNSTKYKVVKRRYKEADEGTQASTTIYNGQDEGEDGEKPELIKPVRHQRQVNTQLLHAVSHNNLDEVRILLTPFAGADPDAYCKGSFCSGLHLAAHRGYSEVLKTLVLHGAEPECVDVYGRTPLHLATMQGHTKCANLLLMRDVDVDAKILGPQHFREDSFSCIDSHDHIECDVEVHDSNDVGKTPLYFAVMKNDIKIIRLLWENDAQPDIVDEAGNIQMSLLSSPNLLQFITQEFNDGKMDPMQFYSYLSMAAVEKGSQEDLRWNLKKMQHLHAEDYELLAKCLYKAVDKEDSEMLNIMLKQKMFLEVIRTKIISFHKNPLDHAVHKKSLVCVESLLSALSRGMGGVTALHIAIEKDYCLAVSYLLQEPKFTAKRDISQRNGDYETPLEICIRKGCVNCIRALLSHDANLRKRPQDCSTPLHVVSAEGKPQILAELLKCKDSLRYCINSKDRNGKTPLLLAVENKNFECVKLLLQHSSVRHFTKEKKTPLHISCDREYEDIFCELMKHKDIATIIDSVDNMRYTALFYSTKNNSSAFVKLLLSRESSVKLCLDNKMNLLHVAVKNNSVDALAILLDYDQCKRLRIMKNSAGRSPSGFALEKGHMKCFDMLLSSVPKVGVDNAEMREIFTEKPTWMTKYSEERNLIEDFIYVMLNNSDLQELLLHDVRINKEVFKIAVVVGDLRMIPIVLRNIDDAFVDIIAAGSVRCIASYASDDFLHALKKHNQKYYVSVLTTTHKTGMNFLHISAQNGNLSCLRTFLKECGNKTICAKTKDEKSALHFAIENRHKHCVKELLLHGSDMCAEVNGRNALRMILDMIPSPVTFLHEVMDSCFDKKMSYDSSEIVKTIEKVARNVYLSQSGFQINLLPLFPVDHKSHIAVLRLLKLNTDTSVGSNQLLNHTLVKVYTHMNWRRYRFFLNLFLILRLLYTVIISSIVVAMKQYHIEWDNSVKIPVCVALYVYVILFEAPQMTWKKGFEMWMKAIYIVLPFGVVFGDYTVPWMKTLIAIAMYILWLDLMLQTSRAPSMGGYPIMFRKIAANMTRLLVVFICHIIGFAFTFYMLLHPATGFENPILSFFKMVRMMVGDVEYNDALEDELDTLVLYMGHISFTLFILFNTIVLMNLLQALAIEDVSGLIQELESHRLRTEIFLLSVMEGTMEPWFRRCFGTRTFKEEQDVPQELQRSVKNILFKREEELS